MEKITLKNENGLEFRVRFVPVGETYGKDHCLTSEKETLVEFFDRRYPFYTDTDGEILGQFVSRYYLSTLTEDSARLSQEGGGLNLDCGIDNWSIDASQMKILYDHIQH